MSATNIETKAALRVLETSSMGWHRQRGHFRDDLVGGVYDDADFVKRGLPAQHGIQQAVRSDGQEVMYWRETASGLVLGLALIWDGEQFNEHLYAAGGPPSGMASQSGPGWAAPLETPPEWA